MDVEFYKNYIQNFTVSPLTRQANLAHKKLLSLKTKKGKDDYVILLYSGYLQIIESVLIFLLINHHQDGITNLFALHKKLYGNIKELLDIDEIDPNLGLRGKSFLKKLTAQICFKSIDDEKLYPYKRFISEAIEDYFKDKDFLNSYKHGMRLSSQGENKIYISMTGGKETSCIGEYNSSVKYYSKKNEIIYQNNISFNYEYIVVKIIFIENFIENHKKHILNSGKTINVDILLIQNDVIYEKYGISRWKTPIFEKPSTK